MELPRSLRTRETEALYQQAKLDGTLRDLASEPRLEEWKYWFLIDNRFMYDKIAETNHMLVIKRECPSFYDLTQLEWQEWMQIRREFDRRNIYHSILDNLEQRRIVLNRYHIHLIKAL